ncbi:scytonemin biosynthesis protein ScyA [Aetokthonos hydrillicola Thurmond2011]|jgi:acetolactate synthase-1/2/3 large subunit|uniref:Scytonemin biosynthesis protein ScyA n=1 Tax=Aetokthonos hydrillicola Thurmond2011 TaxID=2712845 RepID=A0AAP5I751_9CYAN|nr:scytonemin biosynthesis protein ScyA [Aetokthonos hydrillicola]MBO3458953.1 scytonemin biosynthesis protein ScyA [Aetokthonos hydrillicola CCALA 1050]MBW4589060.1 scytonemin biosynthesis protein ScyA [Aetokthonos hydrillicola CCALA 1050]MDR9894984.1 scytonemin biosynthesis protein ScyA [Aetokthonos hydrillicola Thurmond2011]
MSQNYTETTHAINGKLNQQLQLDSLVASATSSTQEVNRDKSTSVLQEEVENSLTVADAIAQMLENLGVCCAFGVAGGAMATIWGSLSSSLLQVLNFRHESGAAFAAVEAYFANGNPTVVFTTAGPGITNALTGLFAARGEGAKVILLSACTSAPQRGRWAIQETSHTTLPVEGIFTSGALFNYATTVECAAQLPQIFRSLALGLSQPGGFVAHLSIPTAVQTSLIDEVTLPQLSVSRFPVTTNTEAIAKTIKLLSEGPFAIWVGFGARDAADEIRQLAEKTGAAVMCSPRGKGIFPEDHPQFVGVTGLGGHTSVMSYMQQQTPLRTLVLGTRLGEPTSFWNRTMVPPGGFVHVDIDPTVPGVAYPQAETLAIQSDIKAFLQTLLSCEELLPSRPTSVSLPHPELERMNADEDAVVRPEVLMQVIQEVIVESSDAIVMAECGNSFTWSTHFLRFNQANRYRVSTGVGAMGHAVTGVVGAACTHKGKAVAIVGDGAMLMNNEINTAVKYQIPAIWIVLNDARYNMCHQGMAMLGMTGADATIPEADFAVIARGMGADGVRVHKESDIRAALEEAIAANGPFVVDVLIDPNRRAPSKGRNQGLLAAQGVKSTPAKKTEMISFPNI